MKPSVKRTMILTSLFTMFGMVAAAMLDGNPSVEGEYELADAYALQDKITVSEPSVFIPMAGFPTRLIGSLHAHAALLCESSIYNSPAKFSEFNVPVAPKTMWRTIRTSASGLQETGAIFAESVAEILQEIEFVWDGCTQTSVRDFFPATA